MCAVINAKDSRRSSPSPLISFSFYKWDGGERASTCSYLRTQQAQETTRQTMSPSHSLPPCPEQGAKWWEARAIVSADVHVDSERMSPWPGGVAWLLSPTNHHHHVRCKLILITIHYYCYHCYCCYCWYKQSLQRKCQTLSCRGTVLDPWLHGVALTVCFKYVLLSNQLIPKGACP